MRIGLTAVLHTWGSALTHHPHVHVIVPGGGLSPDGTRWIACRPGFFLSVRVLSRLFRRLFLEGLAALYDAGRLTFFGDLALLSARGAFDAALAPLRRSEWVVFAKRPFAGPQAVLAYLARYTHRVAISNSRLIALDDAGVTFKRKDYRIKGRDRLKTMTLDAAEFIRRFLMHVLHVCAQSSQRSTWPPSAEARQVSIADMIFKGPRPTWPALAVRHAGPWARKMSATSRRGRAMGRQAGGGRLAMLTPSRSRELVTSRIVLTATRV